MTPEIRMTPIGTVNQGIDGRDEYVLIVRLDDDLTPNDAREWLLPQVYRESSHPGGYFCTSVTILPRHESACVAIIHRRYDV